MCPGVDLYTCMCNTIQEETPSEDLGVSPRSPFSTWILPVTSCPSVTWGSCAVHRVSLVQRPEHSQRRREVEQWGPLTCRPLRYLTCFTSETSLASSELKTTLITVCFLQSEMAVSEYIKACAKRDGTVLWDSAATVILPSCPEQARCLPRKLWWLFGLTWHLDRIKLVL